MCAKASKILMFQRWKQKIMLGQRKSARQWSGLFLSMHPVFGTSHQEEYLQDQDGPTQSNLHHPQMAPHLRCGGNVGDTGVARCPIMSACSSPHHSVQNHQLPSRCEKPRLNSPAKQWTKRLQREIQADSVLHWLQVKHFLPLQNQRNELPPELAQASSLGTCIFMVSSPGLKNFNFFVCFSAFSTLSPLLCYATPKWQ